MVTELRFRSRLTQSRRPTLSPMYFSVRGHKKMNVKISRTALLATAALLLGGVAAQAADLGGNCCADLEERVAELEATTARKGNRKVSLTVSGQINEAVIFWDDGVEKNAYVASNNISRTRFRFLGNAKITNDVSAGYLLEIGVRYASSSNRNQLASGAGGNENNLDIRHSAWYLDSKSMGRVWVGQTSSATDGIVGVNLANMPSATNEGFLEMGGFRLRTPALGSAVSGVTWLNIASQVQRIPGDGDRYNVVKYDSPTIAGFIASASWGEDDRVDAALRYAGEFSGIRLAAAIGYSNTTDVLSSTGGCANTAGFNTPQTGVAGSGAVSGNNCSMLGGSASVMHVPTGLFVTGSAGKINDKNRQTVFTAAAAGLAGVSDQDTHWALKGGIEQKFVPLGKTTVYGEYFTQTTGGGMNAGQPRDMTSLGGQKFMTGAQIKWYGIGINQNIESAATDLYLSYRHYSANVDTSNGVVGAGGIKSSIKPNDFQAIMAGALIKF
jgi:hypothetical protein